MSRLLLTTLIRLATEDNKDPNCEYDTIHEAIVDVMANTGANIRQAALAAIVLWTTDTTYDSATDGRGQPTIILNTHEPSSLTIGTVPNNEAYTHLFNLHKKEDP